jgi:hypothetical protein
MADSKGYFTLRQVVLSALNRTGVDEKYFEQMATIAAECFAELNIYYSDSIRVAYLPISKANMVALPDDYIDYVRNPSVIANNRIHTLTEDNKIPLDTPIDCGNDTNPQPIHKYSEAYGEGATPVSYGTGGGKNIGYYRIDKQNRVIRLSGLSVPHSSVGKKRILYLEYVSTGLSLDSETIVPREVVPVIRQYLIWQSVENDPRMARGDKDAKMEQYYLEIERLVHFQNSFTIDQFVDTIRREYRQVKKR